MCFYEVKKGWKLKKEWSEKDADTARNYARQMWTFARNNPGQAGRLYCVNGVEPKTSAEFVGRLAFTSSSDFAALWVCDMEVAKGGAPCECLHGIAIDADGRPVSVWDVYKNGNEVGTVYACGAHWVYTPAGGSV